MKYQITWKQEVLDKHNKIMEEIKKAKDEVIPDEFFKKRNNKDYKKSKEYSYYSSILTLKAYEPRKTTVVFRVFPNLKQIHFRFYFDHFQWNIFEPENFNEQDIEKYLIKIYNEILNKFSYLYKGIDYVSFLESLRFWDYKKSVYLTIE